MTQKTTTIVDKFAKDLAKDLVYGQDLKVVINVADKTKTIPVIQYTGNNLDQVQQGCLANSTQLLPQPDGTFKFKVGKTQEMPLVEGQGLSNYRDGSFGLIDPEVFASTYTLSKTNPHEAFKAQIATSILLDIDQFSNGVDTVQEQQLDNGMGLMTQKDVDNLAKRNIHVNVGDSKGAIVAQNGVKKFLIYSKEGKQFLCFGQSNYIKKDINGGLYPQSADFVASNSIFVDPETIYTFDQQNNLISLSIQMQQERKIKDQTPQPSTKRGIHNL